MGNKEDKSGLQMLLKVTPDNRALIEEALRMRCAGYLDRVKAQLLKYTIFEVDAHKNEVKKINAALNLEIEQRKLSERRLSESEARFRDFAEIASDWLWECDGDLILTFVSENCARFFKGRQEDFVGRHLFDVEFQPGVPVRCGLSEEQQAVLLAGRAFRSVEYRFVDANGAERYLELTAKPLYTPKGRRDGYRGSAHDVTWRRQAEERNLYLANHDGLTGLPVFRLVEDRAQIAFTLAARHGDKVAVLFIDLDNFKTINDVHGHQSGDLVLQTTAQRLNSLVRASDTVGRIGGDEFIAIISDVREKAALDGLLEKFVRQVSQPINLGGPVAAVGVSVGASFFPEDGETLKTLMEKADQAMYRVKSSGKNGFCYYTA
ncbi:MAG: hypothetical protein C0622_07030 [Desulfuromonas sp.]|nr:MAG: hypothetical protein C0622_07030 [Desulfuromonas sp.]